MGCFMVSAVGRWSYSASSKHPQFRSKRLLQLVQQYLADDLAVEVDSSKRRHTGPQQSVAVFDDQFYAVSHPAMLVWLAFAPDPGNGPAKELIGKGSRLQADRFSDLHIADFRLWHSNAKQQSMCVSDTADFRALAEVLSGLAGQIFAENGAREWRDQLELSAPAVEQSKALFERLDQCLPGNQLAIEFLNLRLLGLEIGTGQQHIGAGAGVLPSMFNQGRFQSLPRRAAFEREGG